MHLGSLESIKKSRVLSAIVSSNFYTFSLLSQLPACSHIQSHMFFIHQIQSHMFFIHASDTISHVFRHLTFPIQDEHHRTPSTSNQVNCEMFRCRCFFLSFDWLVDRSIDWSIGWSVDWLVDLIIFSMSSPIQQCWFKWGCGHNTNTFKMRLFGSFAIISQIAIWYGMFAQKYIS